MGSVAVHDVDAAVNVMRCVTWFCVILGRLVDDLDQAVNTFRGNLAGGLLLEHLKPDNVGNVKSLNGSHIRGMDLVDVMFGEN